MIEQIALPQKLWRRRLAWLMLLVAMILGLVAILLYAVSVSPFQAAPALRSVADVPLPGGVASFDQQAFDATSKRLFVTHPGNNEVIVLDTTTNTVVGHIQNIKKNHGIVVIPEIGRVYIAETFDNQVYVVDEKSLHVLSRIAVGQKPDVMTYDPNDHLLFVSNELGHSDTVIDVRTNRALATIPLGGEVGNSRYDASSHRVWVALQTLNQIVALDPTSGRVVGRVSLPKTCNHDHGLVLDESQHLGIVECDVSATLFLLDLTSMQVLTAAQTTQAVPASPDIMAVDESQHMVYVSSHTGTLTLFNDSNRTLQKVAQQCIAANAHAVLVDQATHNVYMPLLSTPQTVCTLPTPAPTSRPNVTPTPAPVNGQPVLRIMQFQ